LSEHNNFQIELTNVRRDPRSLGASYDCVRFSFTVLSWYKQEQTTNLF